MSFKLVLDVYIVFIYVVGGRVYGCVCRRNGCVLEIRLPVCLTNTCLAGVDRARHHAAGLAHQHGRLYTV